MDIGNTGLIRAIIGNALIEMPTFPNRKTAFQPEGKSSADILDRLFERYIRGRRKKQMEMVRHDDKCVKLEAALTPVPL